MSIRWGFIGTGRVAHRFIAGMKEVEEAVPTAVFDGLSIEYANKFANEFDIKNAYDSIDEFVKCPDIDIAYIAVTNPHHKYFAMKCLEAKIPVLCEKPMAPNVLQEKEIIECAKKNDVFLMEGMWTHTFPATIQAMQWIEEGRIGKIVAMNSIFAIKAPEENEHDRLFLLKEAGGTLLDIAIYNIALAHRVFEGAPKEIATLADISEKMGTDRTAGIVFKYGGGEIATILSSFRSEGRDIVTIYGTDGTIEIFDDFWRPRNMRLTYRDGIVDYKSPIISDDTVYGSPVSFKGEGYQFEIKHVHDCLNKGLKESPIITHQRSIDVITSCDNIRKIWGVKFPFEVE